jgi:hypothetical protein
MALYTISDDTRLTRVTDKSTQMWKHVKVLINEDLHVEAWDKDGGFVLESTHIVRMDLEPKSGDKRLTTASGTRYYLR